MDRVNAQRSVKLKPCFAEPQLDVMNFLSQIVSDYPDAISFAPGRPLEEFFDVEHRLAGVWPFVDGVARAAGIDSDHAWQDLGQYGRTNGQINGLIAEHLRRDEGINVTPDTVMVTVGAQEAMAVLLAGMFQPGKDLLLVSDPCYIGITGLARVLGIDIVPIEPDQAGLEPSKVDRTILESSRRGRVRALYDVPDFNNPLGTSLSLSRRQELLAVCRRHDVFLIEDNPYGMFAYDMPRLPTLKSLDRDASVLYIGTFSKTLLPALRVGYLVADQRLDSGASLAQGLSRVKSLLTVSTPTIPQAVVGRALQAADCSIETVAAPLVARCRRNRDEFIAALAREFADLSDCVRWNHPAGGFFVSLSVPFDIGHAELHACAAEYGVVMCPMQFFAIQSDRRRQMRLSFSYVDEQQIALGVHRLARFVRDRVRH